MENRMTAIVWFVFSETILEGKSLYCNQKGKKGKEKWEFFNHGRTFGKKKRKYCLYYFIY